MTGTCGKSAGGAGGHAESSDDDDHLLVLIVMNGLSWGKYYFSGYGNVAKAQYIDCPGEDDIGEFQWLIFEQKKKQS